MDRNVDRAFGLSLSVIAYSLFLALIGMIYFTAYRYFDVKVSGEGMNQALVKTDAYAQEEEDLYLYTGEKMSSAEQRYVKVTKLSDADYRTMGETVSNKAHSVGEVVTGAAVYAEIMSLPANVKRITIDGHTLCNEASDPTVATVGGAYPNIAYYVSVGDTKHLAEEADIDFVNNYLKYYIYDDNGYIKQIVYTKN